MNNFINKKQENLWKLIIQFSKFGIIGVLNAVVNLSVYYVLVHLGAHYLIANFMAFMISVLNAYLLNNKFVFKKTQQGHMQPLIKVYITYGLTFLLGSGFMFLMISIIGVSKWLAPIINIMFMTPLNFILSKNWALK